MTITMLFLSKFFFRLIPCDISNTADFYRYDFERGDYVALNNLLCGIDWHSLLTNTQFEKRPTFNTCNSGWAHITCTTNDQHSSSSCEDTTQAGLLHIIGSTTIIFAVLKAWFMLPLHCVIKWEVVLHWFDLYTATDVYYVCLVNKGSHITSLKAE